MKVLSYCIGGLLLIPISFLIIPLAPLLIWGYLIYMLFKINIRG